MKIKPGTVHFFKKSPTPTLMTFTGALTPANSMQVSIMQLGQYILRTRASSKSSRELSVERESFIGALQLNSI